MFVGPACGDRRGGGGRAGICGGFRRNRKRGEQVIQVMIKTPSNLSKKQEDLLREFAKLEKGKFSNKLKHILKGDSSSAAK